MFDGPCVSDGYYASELIRPDEVIKLIQLLYHPPRSWFNFFSDYPYVRWLYYTPDKEIPDLALAVFGDDPYFKSSDKRIAIARSKTFEMIYGEDMSITQSSRRLAHMNGSDLHWELEWARKEGELETEEKEISAARVCSHEHKRSEKKRKTFQACGVGPPEYSSD